MDPAVSVVVPAYNPGPLIVEALDSLMAQTYQDFEAFVVDDASTDGLETRLSPYQDRIHYIRFETNRGPSAARNEAIRRARGRYIALLDADDVWRPRHLEAVVGFLEAHPEVGFATADMYLLLDARRTEISFFSTPLTRFHHHNQDVHILRSNFVGNKLVIRRELFFRHGLYDESHWRAEDWDRAIAFILGGERAGFVDEPLTYHRQAEGTLSTFGPWLEERLRVLERWQARPMSAAAKRALRDSLARTRWEVAKQARLQGTGRRGELWRVARSGRADVRLKALLWLVLPAGPARRLRDWRFRRIDTYGAQRALDLARTELDGGNLRQARRHVTVAVLYGDFAPSVRLWAAAWLMFPPLRGALGRRLFGDRPRRSLRTQVMFVLRFIWRHPANRGRRLRRLTAAVAFQLKGRVLRRPSVTRLGDRSLIVAHLHVYNSSKAVYANPPDWPEMLVWREVLRPGDLFIDVGANVGLYTIWALEAGAQVVAVEPGKDSVARLNENLLLNGYFAEVLQAVLADHSGRMKVTTGLDMGNHLMVGEEEVGGEEVRALTLDEVLGGRVAAGVKIDVEGAEQLVLAGAQRSLEEKRIRLIQIEWNDRSMLLLREPRSKTEDFLRKLGYELLRPSDDGGLIPVAKPGLGPDVFARPRA